MREDLLSILAQPGTRAPLTLENARYADGDEPPGSRRVEEGQLVAPDGKRYPIVRGIPRFVEGDTYAESFGMQWNHFREVQLDSDGHQGQSWQRFEAEAGWSVADLEGKWLLDAGCGAGRFAEVAAARGPRLVALDYSSAVEATAKTLARFPNADVVQGSLLEPPFREGVFDFAYCIGVIQHTPDPPLAAAQVLRSVKAGGRFCLTIYARQPWTKLNGKYLVRPLTRRLGQKTLLRAIETVMPVVFPVTDALFRLPLLGRAARFVLPVATYTDDTLPRERRYAEAVLDTFDMLSPAYDDPMTAEEVEGVLRREDAKRWTFRTRVPINVVGER